jgi:hypothetical protein
VSVCAEVGAEALGLVQLETSDTRRGEGAEFLAFAHDFRLQRMRQGVRWSASYMEADAGGRREYRAMITLTYRDEVRWHRRHISEFVKRVREHLRRRGIAFRYVWVLELTKRHRPHYHLVVWLPVGTMLPKPDRQGWWDHGSSRIERARSPIGYLVKYASKGVNGGDLPKGARLHGVGGLTMSSRLRMAWRRLPGYVRDVWGSEHRATRAKGGGFVSRLIGEWIQSPWVVEPLTSGWEQMVFRRRAYAAVVA